MSAAGGHPPFTDVSGRMEVFGRLFGEQVGVPDLDTLPTSASVLAVVRARVPRGKAAGDDAPVFEAAAFVGEWLRRRVSAVWIAQGPYEPQLQLADATHAIVYLLPLVQLIRTASTAGYDGMAMMLDHVMADVARPAQRASLKHLRVEPEEEREAVSAWARANRGVRGATHASLWRRCSICSQVQERSTTLRRVEDDWEKEAENAASVLSSEPFACPCGGPPGSTSRLLMMRNRSGVTRLGDIYVASTHTRVGCWTMRRDDAEPYDALALTRDDMLAD